MNLRDMMVVKTIADPGSGNEVMEIIPQYMPSWGALYQASTGTQGAVTGTPVKITTWNSLMWTPRIMVPDYTTNNNITLGDDIDAAVQKVECHVFIRIDSGTNTNVALFIEYNYGAGYGFNTLYAESAPWSPGANSIYHEIDKTIVLSCIPNSTIALYVSCNPAVTNLQVVVTSYLILKRIA